MQGERIEVGFDGDEFFDYRPNATVRPYVDGLYTVDGVRITRDIAVAPEGSDDHPHHKGVWWGHRDLAGADVWTEFAGHGSIRAAAPPRLVEGGGRFEIIHETRWLDAAGRPLLDDTRILTAAAAAVDGSQALDVETVMRASSGSVVLADTKEAGLVALRVAPALEERRGGRIELSTGAVGEAFAWGKRADWCDYSGSVGADRVGVAIFDHPENPLPARWHVRDYGLLAVNPFGLSDFTGDRSQDGSITLEPGHELRFRYRILVHRGSAAKADIAGHYARYLADREVAGSDLAAEPDGRE
ncbi:PmoA family protein [Leifsonia poae]|uniref:DUF6807 domain-containing protein n=1 Tax=Leifsonia poae TaxID=110933 RepID=UPI003D67567E